MTDEITPLEPSPTAESPQPEDEFTRLRQALEETKRLLEEKTAEARDNLNRYLRAAAELDNLRKRTQREREEYIRFANESLLRELLPVLDNFDRALEAARAGSEAQGVVAGVELIQRELLKVLEKFGVTPYSALGQPFDPERHEAVQRVFKPDAPDMTVVAETQRGYLLNGRVLRPAMVVVAVPPDSDAA